MEKGICSLPQGMKLVNSFFATNILPKAENMINRYLRKKGIDKKNRLVVPINDKNHWYFAYLTPDRIEVFDSMRKSGDYYAANPIFRNAVRFGRILFDGEIELGLCQDYPQQDNCYDCGVFMLMGIRDLLSQRRWTYQQGDIRFKRIQIAS